MLAVRHPSGQFWTMNKRQFLKDRTGAWKRFEYLLNRYSQNAGRKMRAKEVLEYSRLFRELSNDLATIRSRAWGEQLDSYVNSLVARGHNQFYSAPPGDIRKVARFLAYGFPILFRKHLPYMLAGTLLFFVPLIVTWVLVQNNPDIGRNVVPQVTLDAAKGMYSYDPDKVQGQNNDSRASMGGFYVWHNTGIAFRCYVGGILMGVMTVYLLVFNGATIGTMAGYVIAGGNSKAFLSFVVSHGSFELTAICISGGAGLMLGNAILHPGQRTRQEALRVQGFESVKLAAGAAVMLSIAAMIEGFWSPPNAVPSVIKFIVGGVLWVAVFAYLGLSGRNHEV